nr:hypothetical protein CFP56_69641 [Quercus suber]
MKSVRRTLTNRFKTALFQPRDRSAECSDQCRTRFTPLDLTTADEETKQNRERSLSSLKAWSRNQPLGSSSLHALQRRNSTSLSTTRQDKKQSPNKS